MKDTIVRCRCGHRVLAKEVLRTELYERRVPGSDSSRDYVYVKYRCRHCKRMGEAFVPESRWEWNILEADRNEMNERERDFFLDEEPISAQDILDFHRNLEGVHSLLELTAVDEVPEAKAPVENASGDNVIEEVRPENRDLPLPPSTRPRQPGENAPSASAAKPPQPGDDSMPRKKS